MKLRFVLVSFLLLGLMADATNAQWSPIGPNDPLSVTSLVEVNGIIYCGSTEGVFGSKDDGLSWYQVDKLPLSISSPVTVLATKDQVFAVTFDNTYASTDNGISWTIRSAGLKGQTVNTIIDNNGVLFAGTSDYVSLRDGVLPGSIFRSVDKGLSWQQMDSSIMVHSVTKLVKRGPVLFAFTDSGIYRSNLDGSKWEDITPFTHGMFDGFLSIGTVGQCLFISSSKGLYRSSDDGHTWENLKSGLPTNLIYYFFTIGKTLYGSTVNNVFQSTDEGTTWNIYSAFPTNVTISTFLQTEKAILVGSDRSNVLIKSFDSGMTWHTNNYGFSTIYVNSLISDNNRVYAGGNNGTFYFSSNNGDGWEESYPHGISIPINDIYIKDSTVLISGEPVKQSTNAGRTWLREAKGDPYGASFCTADSFLFLGGFQGIYRSSDWGISWTYPYQPTFNDKVVQTLTFANNILFAGTDNDGIFISRDLGATWLSLFTPDSVRHVSSIVFLDSVLFVCSNKNGGVVFRSTDMGATWKSLLVSCYSLTTSPFLGHVIFAAGRDGVKYSRTLGENWIPVNSGLPDATVSCLSVSSSYLYAGTRGKGVWRLPLEKVFVPSSVTVPLSSTAGAIFPNPCSTLSTIFIHSIEDQYIQIKIVDLLGNIVATPYSGQMKEGDFSFDWNAASVPSGMYRCSIQRNGTVETLPLIVTH
jgi:photosystem II stability/assembly factor-like uncharacterized protein